MPLTVGAVLPFSVTVTDSSGAPANPTTMTLTITQPDGISYTGSPFTITPTVTGQFDKDVVSTQAGRWVGYWLATGVNGGSYTQVFDVRPSTDPGIISLTEAKQHLNIPLNITVDDDEIQNWIQGITRVVEDRIGPVLSRTVVERVDSGWCLWLRQTPVISVTSIVPWLNHGTTYSVAGVRVDPDTGRVESLSGFAFVGGPFQVTYTAGRLITPINVVQAVKIILQHLWETQRGASGLPLAFQADDTTVIPGFGFAVPNRALELLQPDDSGPGVA